MRLQTISTWDEAAFFGGGHADIASTGDYEVPALMKESGQDYVVFGIYNLGRVPIFVKTDSPYHTIKDLEGKKIGTDDIRDEIMRTPPALGAEDTSLRENYKGFLRQRSRLPPPPARKEDSGARKLVGPNGNGGAQ